MLLTECSNPPNGEFVTSSLTSSPRPGEFYTGAVVTYKCNSSHSLVHGQPQELTCGRNGDWNHDLAPRCAPRK